MALVSDNGPGKVARAYREVDDYPGILDVRTFLMLTALTTVIGLAVWLSMAELDSATAAPGELRVESHRKTLKVLESGVVKRLMVSEGDRVAAGQPLIELDPTKANANVEILQRRRYAMQAQLARFQAEATGQTAVPFPDELLERAADPDVQAAVLTEADLFEARRNALQARREVSHSRIEQLGSQIASTDNQIAATEEQLRLITDELESIEFLLDKELVQRSRYRAVQREHVALKARLSDHLSKRAQIESEIGATEMRLLDVEEAYRNEALTQVSALQVQLLELAQQINSATNTAGLLTLKAPIGGTVVNLQVFGEDTVVLGGEPLMDIVPETDALVVDAKVSPDDIENVSVGMKAKVRMTGLNTHTTPLLEGKVSLVSADLASPEDAEEKYYLATVLLGAEELAKLDDIDLSPGMEATVMIVKGERTVLEYLLSPLMIAAETAMREP